MEGPANPAEGLLIPGNEDPNDVYALGPFGGYAVEGELFQSSSIITTAITDITNVDRMSAALGVGPAPGGPPYLGPFAPSAGEAAPAPAPPGGLGTFGLLAGDDIDALSFGNDGGNVLLFSVTPRSVGVPGSAAYFQSQLSPPTGPIGKFPPGNGGGDPGHEAAGDLFRSSALNQFGGGTGPVLVPAPPSTNAVEVGEASLGLQAPATTWAIPLGPSEDDLDALEASDGSDVDVDNDGVPEGPVYFSLDVASVTTTAMVADPFPGLSTGADPDGVTADDILISPPPGGPFFRYAIFARGASDIGLLAGDELDALALWDTPPIRVLNAGDEILFSLGTTSPSLTAGSNANMPPGGHSGADIFRRTFTGAPGGPITIYATATTVGLLATDDIDAIDVGTCTCASSGDADGDGIPNLCEVCLTPALPTENQVVRTGGILPREILLDVANNGRFAAGNTLTGMWRFKDSSFSIYDASLMVAHGAQMPDTVVFLRFFERVSNGQAGLVPIAPLSIDSSAYGTGAGYVRVLARMVTVDCQVGVKVEWAFPQSPTEDEFALVRYSLYSASGAVVSDLATGVIIDFDVVPAARYVGVQDGVTNDPGSDAARQLTWQRGVDVPGHIIIGTPPITATRYRAGARAIGSWRGSKVGNNPDDLWPGGGPTDGLLYQALASLTGFDLFADYSSDLYSLIVFDRGVSLGALDTVRYTLAMVTDTLNEASFKAASDAAVAAAAVAFGPTCSCPCYADPQCDGIRSDVLDLVNVISVAFRGVAPVLDPDCPTERTDVDNSGAIDVIDVTKVVNVAFRGQSAAANYVDPCAGP